MHFNRRSFLAASSGAALLAASGARAQTGSNLGALLDQISTNILRDSPEYCTYLAVSVEQAGGPYINRSSDATREAGRKSLQILKDGLAQLNALDGAQLNAQEHVTLEVVKTSFENDIASGTFEPSATNPYVVSQLTGVYTQVPDFLDSAHPVTNREQAEAYLSRLAYYAKQLDQQTALIGEDSQAGFTPPDFAIDKALVQLNAFASKHAADTVLVTSLARRLPDVAEIAEADRPDFVSRAQTIVQDEVLPAYYRQIGALMAVRPRATHDAGIWRLPDGEARYAAALRNHTTTNMSPDEIHDMGVDLVHQMQSEMDAILRRRGLRRGSVAERVQELSKRPDQLYPNTDAGREQLLADLNKQVQHIRSLMPRVCGVLAKADLQIKRVPEYTQDGAPGGYYNGAALDGSRPGQYYINLRDTAEWPKFTLPTLTYHEGIPGHHWQISIAQESHGLPFIRSALLGFNAYAEGWGLYAEQLADEMGVYDHDPLGRLGYLQSAAFRASRLVVDTGIHHKRWTREQAIQSMLEATGDQESSVTTEIERYCVWPGQACAYMVGRQAITRMRENAKTALGRNFDIKGFHDVVLTNGSTPLSVTESLVQQWVASVSGPAQ